MAENTRQEPRRERCQGESTPVSLLDYACPKGSIEEPTAYPCQVSSYEVKIKELP
jgi:hypothetical protein